MTDQVDRTALPIRRPAFSGVANKTLGGSQPDWELIGHVSLQRGLRTCCWCSSTTRASATPRADDHHLLRGRAERGPRMDHTVPFGFSGYSGLDVGQDNGLVVDRGYAGKAPFAFTGTVKKVVFDVAPHPDGKDELALHTNARQADTARGMNA